MKMQTNSTISKFIKMIGVTLTVYLLMRVVLPAVIPFLIGAGLTMLLHPFAMKIKKRTNWKSRRCNAAAFGIFLAILLAVAAGILFLVYYQFVHMIANAEGIGDWMVVFGKEIKETVTSITKDMAPGVQERILSEVTGALDNVTAKVSSVVMEASVNSLKNVAGFLAVFIIILVSTLLILNDYDNFSGWFKKSTLGQYITAILYQVFHAGGSYLKAQLKIIGIIAIICVVGLLLTGNPYAIPAGMGIAICDALPILGTGTILIPWMLFDILQNQYLLAFEHGIIYGICFVTRQFLEPKLIGKGIGIHPLLVLISIYAGIFVYGGVGVLLGPVSMLFIREIYNSL